jgi:hypothetical protein
MEVPIRVKLDAIFERYELSKQAEAERTRFDAESEEAALKLFAAVRDNVIRPAMEEIGEYVEAKGYTYTIDTRPDAVRADGTPRKAYIRLTFNIGDSARREDHPGLTVFCDKSRSFAQFHARTCRSGRGGKAGLVGEFEIGDVTREIVQAKILALIDEVFR